jgi:acyl-CoA synthetase (AMP-forming)/AMP-acid ligase II
VNPLADRVRSTRSRARNEETVADRRSSLADSDLLSAAAETADAIRAAAGREHAMVAAVLSLSTDALVMLTAAVVGDFSLCFLDPVATDRRRAVLDVLRPDVLVEGTTTPAQAATGLAVRDHPPGYVAMSSGSMGGGPKAVLSPWSNIDAFVAAGAEALELDRGSVWAEVSHPSYDVSMTNLLVALAIGCSIRLSSSLGDRLRPLGFSDRVGATHMRAAPRFIDLAAIERSRDGKRSLRVWGSGGDRLPAASARQLFGLGIPTIVNTYGTSETIGFASAVRLTADDDLPTVHGTVAVGTGTVGPWRACLRDPGDDSMLVIESSHLPDGYLFGWPQGEYPRWETADRVLTGDLGARRGRDLYCLGRVGRRVKRSASFVDLDVLDSILKETLGVTSFTAAMPTGELVTLVEGSEGRLHGLRRALPTVLRPDTVPDELVVVRQLPLLGNGKVDQGAAERLAAQSVGASRPSS